jgi:hypothetical protein
MDATTNRSYDGQAIGVLARVVHDLRDALQRILGCAEVLLEARALEDLVSEVDLLRRK